MSWLIHELIIFVYSQCIKVFVQVRKIQLIIYIIEINDNDILKYLLILFSIKQYFKL